MFSKGFRSGSVNNNNKPSGSGAPPALNSSKGSSQSQSPCPFKRFGCGAQLAADESHTHLTQEVSEHLWLVVEKMEQQFEMQAFMLAHFTEQIEDQLEKAIKRLRDQNVNFGAQLQAKLEEEMEKGSSSLKQLEKQVASMQATLLRMHIEMKGGMESMSPQEVRESIRDVHEQVQQVESIVDMMQQKLQHQLESLHQDYEQDSKRLDHLHDHFKGMNNEINVLKSDSSNHERLENRISQSEKKIDQIIKERATAAPVQTIHPEAISSLERWAEQQLDSLRTRLDEEEKKQRSEHALLLTRWAHTRDSVNELKAQTESISTDLHILQMQVEDGAGNNKDSNKDKQSSSQPLKDGASLARDSHNNAPPSPTPTLTKQSIEDNTEAITGIVNTEVSKLEEKIEARLDAIQKVEQRLEQQHRQHELDLRATQRKVTEIEEKRAISEEQLTDTLSSMENDRQRIARTEARLEETRQSEADLRSLIRRVSEMEEQEQRSLQKVADRAKEAKEMARAEKERVDRLEATVAQQTAAMLVVQGNLTHHAEYVEKDREREKERLRVSEQVRKLESSVKQTSDKVLVLESEWNKREQQERAEKLKRDEAIRMLSDLEGKSVTNSSISKLSEAEPKVESVPETPSKKVELAVKEVSTSKPSSSSESTPAKEKSSDISPAPSPVPSSPSESVTPSRRRSTLSEVSGDGETGTLWEFNPSTNKWMPLTIRVRMDKKPFAEGALREAFYTTSLGVDPVGDHPFPDQYPLAPMVESNTSKNEACKQLTNGTKFVSKTYKKSAEKSATRELYFEDVKMQIVCREWGHKFNLSKPPKKIEFLCAWVLELVDRKPPILCAIEPLLVGEYKKNNSNYGAVLNARSTPQAFSHFTYEQSGKQLIIVDIQGVEDVYTDPQIHTIDGKGFGLGNLGKNGISQFLNSHKCNAVCALLGLDLSVMGGTSSGAGTLRGKHKQLRGTMIMPDILGDLAKLPPLWKPFKVGAKALPSIDASKKKELKCTQTIQAFRDRANALCFLDNRYLCVSSADSNTKIYDTQDAYKCKVTLQGHKKSVEALCSNSKYLFTGSADNIIKVWDPKKDFSCIKTLADHTGEITALVANEKYLFSASHDKTIKVWELDNLGENKSLENHTKSVKCLCLSGRYLFSGSNDLLIYVWDLTTLTCVFSLEGHEEWVLALASRGNFLFSCSRDNTVKVWDLTDFRCVETIKAHYDAVSCLVVADRLLFTGSEDNSIKVWDLNDLSCIANMVKSHNLGIKALYWRDNESQLVSCACDGKVKIWEP